MRAISERRRHSRSWERPALICSNVSSSGEMIPSYEVSDVSQENLMDQELQKFDTPTPKFVGDG